MAEDRIDNSPERRTDILALNALNFFRSKKSTMGPNSDLYSQYLDKISAKLETYQTLNATHDTAHWLGVYVSPGSKASKDREEIKFIRSSTGDHEILWKIPKKFDDGNYILEIRFLHTTDGQPFLRFEKINCGTRDFDDPIDSTAFDVTDKKTVPLSKHKIGDYRDTVPLHEILNSQVNVSVQQAMTMIPQTD